MSANGQFSSTVPMFESSPVGTSTAIIFKESRACFSLFNSISIFFIGFCTGREIPIPSIESMTISEACINFIRFDSFGSVKTESENGDSFDPVIL